ncbi:MAG TPA: rhomboid family intramembrane serine protease [Hyphomicrobiaceae bacterium]|nr:rhomboid family intramembrane serine protease [Hyphomicrobiaceae bacterium]
MAFIPISDDNPLRAIHFQWVTFGLIAANVIVFLLQLAGDPVRGDAAMASFALIPSELFHNPTAYGSDAAPAQSLAVPEWATLITYQFLHGGVLHLASNMLFLWVFGDNVEDALGHLRFLVFYLLCGVAGGLAHALFVPSSPLPLVGASGAIAGVIAAYLMLHPRVRVWVLAFRILPLRVPASVVLGIWAATQLVMVLPGFIHADEVAWWAHVGGLAAGAVLVLFMRRPGVPLFDRGLGQPAIERRYS